MTSIKLEFDGAKGVKLAARLDLPNGAIKAYAIFAHCFTCSKDFNATKRVSEKLAKAGLAVLRFDFTGLGSSHGEFASTNFSSNVGDILRAADFLRQNYEAPSLLIGHSLGGAAVLVAGGQISEINGIVTIGAPSDANHVTHNFAADISTIEKDGIAEVTLGGRKFSIEKQFLEDLASSSVKNHIANLKKPLLVFHSPTDQVVGIENAAEIFQAAKHPKSFVSLDTADHLLTRAEDAEFVSTIIASWAKRYLVGTSHKQDANAEAGVRVTETNVGKFQNTAIAGKHSLLADEPESYGGLDSGPTPYDFLSIALGACTNMTLRMYAERKGWDLGQISVNVSHNKIHAADCESCDSDTRQSGGRIDQFSRDITIENGSREFDQEKLLEIADKCPVHKTLHAGSAILTKINK